MLAHWKLQNNGVIKEDLSKWRDVSSLCIRRFNIFQTLFIKT